MPRRIKPFVASLLAGVALIGLAACAGGADPQTAGGGCYPAANPLRPGLAAKWRKGDDVCWPPHDGFAAPPQRVVLAPGTVLDRYGKDSGSTFSLAGAAYPSRALPYVCKDLIYSRFVVVRQMEVDIGQAAPWFDEPGGASQLQGAGKAEALLAGPTPTLVRIAPEPKPDCVEP